MGALSHLWLQISFYWLLSEVVVWVPVQVLPGSARLRDIERVGRAPTLRGRLVLRSVLLPLARGGHSLNPTVANCPGLAARALNLS